MIQTIITLLMVAPNENNPSGYIIGAVISLMILVYLGYSLVKPEKF
jgi:K+-transporting ATPase KdpF subunit